MRVSLSQFTTSKPDAALDAAEQWLLNEAPDLTPHRGITSQGLQYVGVEQLIDGIAITSTFTAEEVDGGCRLSFRLRMRGQSFLGKIRNLGMLPMTRIVRRASIAQFQQILDHLSE